MIIDHKRGMLFLLSGVIAGFGLIVVKKHRVADDINMVITDNRSTTQKSIDRPTDLQELGDINIKKGYVKITPTPFSENISDRAWVDNADTIEILDISNLPDSINLRLLSDNEVKADTINSLRAGCQNALGITNGRDYDFGDYTYKNKNGKSNTLVSIGGIFGLPMYRMSSYSISGIDPSNPNAEDFGGYEIHHGIPLAISLNIYKQITDRFGLESGIQFTALHSKLTSHTTVINVTTQYIGMPLRIRYYGATTGKFTFYGSTGAMVEFPIKGFAHTSVYGGGVTDHNFRPSIQWSLSLGVGVEYNLGANINVFAEPSINYYFEPSDYYPTIRQDQPVELALPIGLRYKW